MGRSRAVRMLVGAAVLAVGVASCSPDPGPGSPEPTSTAAPVPSETVTATEGPSEAPDRPRPAPYRPHPAEVDRAVKRTAARAVEALPEVRRVTFTQYFGYLPPAANILVEADLRGGEGTTYAVPVRRTERGWRADSPSPGAAVPPLPDPSRLVRQVLESDRIDLNAGGRVDVAAGLVADTVLRSMLAVAEEHRIGVSVVISAHPVNVFGTDRRSNHPDGLAYDIGRVDGRLAVEPGAARLVSEVMRLAASTGAYQVGGPEDLDGGGSQYFADLTHSDHVHVGFTG